MKSISWEQFASSADGYYRRINKNKATFTPELLYNLCAMAIEQYFMALCVFHDKLPDNHRFSDLIDSAASVAPLEPTLIKALMEMESLQEICSLEAYTRKKCTPEDVPVFIQTTESVRNFVLPIINNPKTV